MQVFAVLADPIRTKILEMLAQRDLSAGQIANGFPVSRPAVSRHLRVLRKARLVRCREKSQRRVYSLNPEALDEIERWVARCRRMWNRRLDALARHLETVPAREAEQENPAKKV